MHVMSETKISKTNTSIMLSYSKKDEEKIVKIKRKQTHN
jgi:hypothetical protein